MTIAFRYRAARSDGSVETGSLATATRASAMEHLSSKGLLPLSIEADDRVVLVRSRVPAADLALGLRSLATLLEAGLPVGRALDAFADIAPATWAGGVAVMKERVRQGQSLSAAIEQSGLGIPDVVVGVIHAAEGGAALSKAVSRAAAIAESTAQLQAAVRSALAYPALLVATGGLSLAVIVGFVLPRFATIVTDLGSELPWLTRVVLQVGAAASSLVWVAPLVLIAATLAWDHRSGRPEAKRRMHEALLHAPFIGRLRMASASSRACASLAALVGGGIPVGAALQFASRAAGDAAVAARLIAARERVANGMRLSDALGLELAITPTARRLLRAGEDSGQVSAMLDRAAHLDAEQFTGSMRMMVRFIEPALIVLFAAVIGTVAAALLQAVYSVRP